LFVFQKKKKQEFDFYQPKEGSSWLRFDTLDDNTNEVLEYAIEIPYKQKAAEFTEIMRNCYVKMHKKYGPPTREKSVDGPHSVIIPGAGPEVQDQQPQAAPAMYGMMTQPSTGSLTPSASPAQYGLVPSNLV